MRLIYAGLVLSLATLGFADTITLKNGTVINGTYLGGSARQVRIAAGDNVQTLDVTDIQRIEFGGSSMASAPAPVAAPAPPPAPRMREDNVMRPQDAPPPPPPPAPMAASGVTLPAGTNLVIRMIDGVDSETARVGQSFAASLDQPVMLNGDTVIPRGADVTVKLVDAKQSGKLTGRAELALSLQSVRVNGQMVDVNTQTVSQQSSSRGARTAKVAGGTAAVGAIIGAIAGGGTGAAIGAGAGAAAGAGAEVLTSGQRIRIPSETRLTFVLDNPVRL
ncbi:MAG: hypothetical protein JST11_28180 [Acidobacteria bacterium]|nr:hypothetical protein [Acidobacteriota bacterium]